MAKKYTYTFKEIAEDVIKKLPGHYKNFDSANATVRATARELGINDINGKGKYKIVPAVQAEIILKAVIERATRRPYTPSTPIEQEIRKAEKKDIAVAHVNIDPAMKYAAQRTVELLTQTGPFEKAENYIYEIPAESPIKNEPVVEISVPDPKLTAVEKKAIADDFELRRKRFYTDVRFFLKFAQTPDERTEIWRALSALYGISAQSRPQPIPTETEEQHDKWSI